MIRLLSQDCCEDVRESLVSSQGAAPQHQTLWGVLEPESQGSTLVLPLTSSVAWSKLFNLSVPPIFQLQNGVNNSPTSQRSNEFIYLKHLTQGINSNHSITPGGAFHPLCSTRPTLNVWSPSHCPSLSLSGRSGRPSGLGPQGGPLQRPVPEPSLPQRPSIAEPWRQ